MSVGEGRALHGKVEIAYDTFGDLGQGEPLLLVMGLGLSMLYWREEFCAGLVEHGFAVARFDNRDTGLSTRFSGTRPPRVVAVLRNPAWAPYRLEDMADDAVAVLDTLRWDSAHIVGMSLGGMIAQTVAIRHPTRTRTLTCISSTPHWRIGRRTLWTTFRLRRARRAGDLAERLVRGHWVIGSPAYPPDEQWLRDLARRITERGGSDPNAARRQGAAILASGDRRSVLATLRVPTLVLHGAADPMIRPAAGRALAATIPDAKLVIFPGMGHDLPRPLWPAVIAEIDALANPLGAEES
ncbi:alpha/beta fold hydrolase [Actinophytocola sp.]|uniref:alpha/beta fold hydrolase n=1 Tax=Actinophytocola sp. TaxID=1872138 RepID=UPI003899DB06